MHVTIAYVIRLMDFVAMRKRPQHYHLFESPLFSVSFFGELTPLSKRFVTMMVPLLRYRIKALLRQRLVAAATAHFRKKLRAFFLYYKIHKHRA